MLFATHRFNTLSSPPEGLFVRLTSLIERSEQKHCTHHPGAPYRRTFLRTSLAASDRHTPRRSSRKPLSDALSAL